MTGPIDKFTISNNILDNIKKELSDDSIDKESLKNYLEMPYSLDEIVEAAEFEKKYAIYTYRYPDGFIPVEFEGSAPLELVNDTINDIPVASAPPLPVDNIPVAESVNDSPIGVIQDGIATGVIDSSFYYEIDRTSIDTIGNQYIMKKVDIDTMISENIEDLIVGEELIRENREKYGDLIDMFKNNEDRYESFTDSDALKDDIINLYDSETVDIPEFEKIYLEEEKIKESLQTDLDQRISQIEEVEKKVELYNNYFGRRKMRFINRYLRELKRSKNEDQIIKINEDLDIIKEEMEKQKNKNNQQNKQEIDFEKEMDIIYRLKNASKFNFINKMKYDLELIAGVYFTTSPEQNVREITFEGENSTNFLNQILKTSGIRPEIRRKKLIYQFLAVYYSEFNENMFVNDKEKFKFIYDIWLQENIPKRNSSLLPGLYISSIDSLNTTDKMKPVYDMNINKDKKTELLKVFKNYHKQMSNFENNKYKNMTSRYYYELEVNKQIDKESQQKSEQLNILKDSEIMKRAENHSKRTYNTLKTEEILFLQNISSTSKDVKSLITVNVTNYGSTKILKSDYDNLKTNKNTITYNEWLNLTDTQNLIEKNHGFIDIPLTNIRQWSKNYNDFTDKQKEIYSQNEIDADNFIWSESQYRNKNRVIKATFNEDTNSKITQEAKRLHQNNNVGKLNSFLSRNKKVLNSGSVFKKLQVGQPIIIDNIYFMKNSVNTLVKITEDLVIQAQENSIAVSKPIKKFQTNINKRFEIQLTNTQASYLETELKELGINKINIFNEYLINMLLNNYLDQELKTPETHEDIIENNERISRLTKSFSNIEKEKNNRIKGIFKFSSLIIDRKLYENKNKTPKQSMKIILDDWLETKFNYPEKKEKVREFLKKNNFYLTEENSTTRTPNLKRKWNKFKTENSINIVGDPPYPRESVNVDYNLSSFTADIEDNMDNYAKNFTKKWYGNIFVGGGGLILGGLGIFGITQMFKDDQCNVSSFDVDTGERTKEDCNPLNIEEMTNYCARMSNNTEGKAYDYAIKIGDKYKRRYEDEGEILAQDPEKKCTADGASNIKPLLKKTDICHQSCSPIEDVEVEFTSQFTEIVTDTCLDKYNIPRGKNKISNILRMTGKSLGELTEECPIEKILALYVQGLTEEEYENQFF